MGGDRKMTGEHMAPTTSHVLNIHRHLVAGQGTPAGL